MGFRGSVREGHGSGQAGNCITPHMFRICHRWHSIRIHRGRVITCRGVPRKGKVGMKGEDPKGDNEPMPFVEETEDASVDVLFLLLHVKSGRFPIP